MKPDKIIRIFFLAGISILSFFAVKALADISDIQYPVPQLGNCKSETDCRNYCDKSENITACLDFAEQNNLMPEEEIEMAKKFLAAGNKGPGECTGKDACETYCNDISHIDECVSFAEKNNLMPPNELREAQKVRDAIKRGIKPPACGSKKSCDSYCEDPSHMEECITFASEAGLMDDKEKGDAQKMLQAMKRGIKPPPCRGKQACDEYCQQPDNMEICMNFAIEAGFMDDKDKEDAQKMLQAIKRGVKPPNCNGKEECDSYCQSDEHFEECANFAEAAGFMSAEDAEMARKTKGKGPGECKGKEECEAFCNNQDNQAVCFKFAEDNDMIPKEELEKMKEGMNQMRGQEGMPPSEENESRSGPGGCATPEECQVYCQANPVACQGFSPPRDGSGDQTRPKTGEDFGTEECAKQGGMWDGTKCDFSARECINQRGMWDGSKCNFHDPTQENIGVDRGGEECAKQGGNWTGSSCNFPPPPSPSGEGPPSSLMEHSFLGAMLRYLLK